MSYELIIKLHNFVPIPFTENMYIISSNDEGMKQIEKLSPKSNIHRDNSFVAYVDKNKELVNGNYLLIIDEDGKIIVDNFIDNKISKIDKVEDILDATSLTAPISINFEEVNNKMWSQLIKVRLFSFKRPKFLIEKGNKGFPTQYIATTDICTSKYLFSQLPITKFDKSAYTYFVDYAIPNPKDGYYLIMLRDFQFHGETKYNIIVKELL